MPRTRASRTRESKFAARLRKARDGRGWSQAALAGKASLSQAMIAYLESGAKEPGWETVIALADALEISTEELR